MGFRLPDVSRVPPYAIIIGSLSFMLLLLAQGGDLEMVCMIVIFLVCAAFSFNVLGGAYTASGFLVVVLTMQEIGVPVLGKILLWQPVQSNLLDPIKLMTVNMLGMVGVLAAAYISRKLPLGTFVSGYLAKSTLDLNLIAYGAFVTNVVVTIAAILNPASPDSEKTTVTVLINAIQHFSGVLLVLGAMLGIYSNIKRTNGEKSLDLLSVLTLLYTFILGVASFSKVGLLTPVFVWLLPALMLKLRFKTLHFIVLGLTICFIQFIGVPIAQVGRSDVQRGTLQQTLTTWVKNPSYFLQMVEVYKQGKLEEQSREANSFNYYGERHLPELLERYSLLAPDDLLISATDQNGTESLPAFHTVECQLISSLLADECDLVDSQNQEGRFAGVIPQSDVTTGVSFGEWADAYHRYGWSGIAVAIPCIFLALFLVLNAAGSVQDSPWPMIYMYLCSGGQGSTEEGIFALLAVVTYWTPRLLIVYWIATRLIPWIGIMFGMKESSRVALATNVSPRSIARRLPAVRPSQNSGR